MVCMQEYPQSMLSCVADLFGGRVGGCRGGGHTNVHTCTMYVYEFCCLSVLCQLLYWNMLDSVVKSQEVCSVYEGQVKKHQFNTT